jgi:hypothetical protein
MAIFRRYPEEIAAECGIPATLSVDYRWAHELGWYPSGDFAMKIGGVTPSGQWANAGLGRQWE